MSVDSTIEVSKLTKCTVISCPNYFHKDLNSSKEDYRFFDFPTDRDVARIWKEKCGVAADHEILEAKVCSNHFKSSDYTDDSRTVLTTSSVPRENLGWMIGMPEVKLHNTPKFDLVKEAVDTNELLFQRFEKLLQEQKPLKEKIDVYEKKISNVKNEIFRIKNAISKIPVKRKNGKMEANLICKVFSQAQINMLSGKKKVVWSYDDMAMAFTLRHIGNKECYLYLKDTLNMPLPALSCIQRWVASNKP